jgi:MoxR-like ATPase
MEKEVTEVNDNENERPSLDQVKHCSEVISRIKKEISKAVIGQEEIIESLIRALLCNGNVLLEGVPGIAKTLSIRSLAEVTGCKANRIQFTVDLLPSDIVGITTYTPQKGFETIRGPIFANFIIADEVNRSPPKTQSALIEAMGEKQVTIGKITYKLEAPFFVMANENPLESSGVYSLPEAQVDRFIFKLIMKYPKIEEEDIIMQQNIYLKDFKNFKLRPVTSPSEIIKMQELTKKIYMSKKIRRYILKIIELTRTKAFEKGKFIEYGASPRASICLFIASKAEALMQGRNFVIPRDVKKIVLDVLRHRLILLYKARAEGITSDDIIQEILDRVEVP